MGILNVQSISKSFNGNKVIDNLSFSVKENTILGFVGPNGAGKTTTMKMILGLLKIDEGKITINGDIVKSGYTDTNKYIGYLPDVPEYYNYMKPKEYLTFCGEISGINKKDIDTKCNELLSIVGLNGINKKIGGFSRGMKQRLGIAQALINNPKILICDEPTSALDPVGRKEVLDILMKIKASTTIIFSTHILSDVEKICDQVLVINKGKISVTGNLEELKSRYKTNKLFVEFDNKETKEIFLNAGSFDIVEEKDNSVIISSSKIENLQKEVINIFANSKIYPAKLEVVEQSIENLLLEAVK